MAKQDDETPRDARLPPDDAPGIAPEDPRFATEDTVQSAVPDGRTDTADARVDLDAPDLRSPRSLFASAWYGPPPSVAPPLYDAPTRTPASRPPATGAPEVLKHAAFDDRYAYRKPLGAGGMGVVNLFRDHTIGRDVAMKVARPLGPDTQSRLRFVREARVQGQLEHPSVVPVYDLGLDPKGDVYFTMQRVRGVSLADVIDGLKGKDEAISSLWTLRRRLAVFNQVCLAVDFVHHRGVIHRDLKPDNIMLGDYGEVYLLDWGLAKVHGAAEISHATERPEDEAEHTAPGRVDAFDGAETIAGEMLGTPGYMAPEQMQGAEDLDGRADVYALGAILFELLTLELLHRQDSRASVIHATLKTDGARPAERCPEAEVPPELDALVHRCTRLDPSKRPPSARDVSRAVEAYLDGDRDLALRRDLAAQRAEDARQSFAAVRDGTGGETEARRRAMREVTAALALDPDNRVARETLVRLLAEPPREMPPEAAAELAARETARLKWAGKMAILGYFGFILYLPFVFWAGVRSWPALVTVMGCTALSAATTWYYVRRPPKSLKTTWPHLLITNLTVAVSSVMLGPLILVPLLALGNTVIYLSALDDQRWRIIALACLSVVAPTVLQWVGVLPASYDIAGGVLQVMPRMIHFPRLPTMGFLLGVQVFIIATVAVFVANLRQRYARAERRIHLHTWQLRQVVPADASEPGPEA